MELGVWGFKPEKYSHLLIGDLMKSFLRELSEPLLTHDLFPRWNLATKIKSSAIQIPYVRSLLASLPPENVSNVLWFFSFSFFLLLSQVATIEYVLNFLTIAIGFEEHSQLSLANAGNFFF